MTSETKSTFFRQSGWMVITTFVGGLFMLGVHVFAPFMGDKQYGLFGTLLAMLNLITIPALGLQTVFAQQTAAAKTEEDRQQLVRTTQILLQWTFFIWIAMFAMAIVFKDRLLNGLTIPNPVALWVTLSIGLAQLWMPITLGVMQGEQKFFPLGWINIINGLGRFIAVALIVLLLHGKATGAIVGAAIGIFAALFLALHGSRDVWWCAKPSVVFKSKEWMARVVPLTIGLGASQFIFSVDMIFVRWMFGENQTGYYSAAGMIARGLVIFTAPLTVVMFPKIVHNVSHGKSTNVLGQTLLATLALGALAATGCTAIAMVLSYMVGHPEAAWIPAKFAAKLQANTSGISTLAQLIPWFVWSMLPLALANVLLSSLLARRNYRVVLYLLLVAALYVVGLALFGSSFLRVIQIVGVCNTVYLLVLVAFSRSR